MHKHRWIHALAPSWLKCRLMCWMEVGGESIVCPVRTCPRRGPPQRLPDTSCLNLPISTKSAMSLSLANTVSLIGNLRRHSGGGVSGAIAVRL